MFDQPADGIWVAIFLLLVLYGLSNTFTVPWRVKRFYEKAGFTDQGASRFEVAPYAESLLLEEQRTTSLYSGEHQGYRVEQFAAVSKKRRKFTLNRVTRKRNQRVWTVTIVALEKPLPAFCARPTFVPEAPEYMLREEAVLFPEDDEFAKKIHVMAPDHQAARKIFNAKVRGYLTGLDPVSLESVQSSLYHRRPRQPHDAGSALQKDLDAAVKMAIAFTEKEPEVTL